MKLNLTFIALLYVTFIFGQSQTVNGIDLNAPMGYNRVGDLHWSENDNHVLVTYASGFHDVGEEFVSTPNRGTTFIESFEFDLNGKTYLLGVHEGNNGLSIGALGLHKNDFTYFILVAISPFDYSGTEEEIAIQTAQEMGRVIGYMVARFTIDF